MSGNFMIDLSKTPLARKSSDQRIKVVVTIFSHLRSDYSFNK